MTYTYDFRQTGEIDVKERHIRHAALDYDAVAAVIKSFEKNQGEIEYKLKLNNRILKIILEGLKICSTQQ
jgi:hypothetical protein